VETLARKILALILSQHTKQLLAMDRYERRARLRREVALRALNENDGLQFIYIQL